MGTHLHRFFCPTTKQQVRSLAPSWIRERLDTFNGSLSPVEHCALIRGMVAPPAVPTRPDSDYGVIMWHTWQVIPTGCSLYTDGSLIDARLGLGLEALGWAFAAHTPSASAAVHNTEVSQLRREDERLRHSIRSCSPRVGRGQGTQLALTNQAASQDPYKKKRGQTWKCKGKGKKGKDKERLTAVQPDQAGASRFRRF